MLDVFDPWNQRPERARRSRSDAICRAAGALATAILCGLGLLSAQAAQPDAAAKFTGRWILNEELTPASGGSGRGRGQASFALAGAAVQRGGRGGGGAGGGGGQPGDASAPLMPEETAAQAALSILHQVPK